MPDWQQHWQHPRSGLRERNPLPLIIAKCREVRFKDFARWRVSRFGLASNERLGALVQRYFDSTQFEDLKIPVGIVATDLGTGDPVLFKEGSISDAVRASCAFPGLFEPSVSAPGCLADGGLVAPVPTKAARDLGAEIVVGVSVGMHDGHAGRADKHFSSRQPSGQRGAKAPGGELGTARGSGSAPGRSSRWPGTISIGLMKRSRQEQPLQEVPYPN